MNDALDGVLAGLPTMLAVQPELAWLVGRGCRVLGRSAASEVEQAVQALECLTIAAPDADLLAAAVDRLQAVVGTEGRTRLLAEAGHWLPAAWAVSLDAARSSPFADPCFVALALEDPARAVARIDHVLGADMGSRRGVGLLYEACIAWHEAGQAVPASIQQLRDRFEAHNRFLVPEDLRYQGRLRLSCRTEPAAGPSLAVEAIEQVGADAVFFGLWAVSARVGLPPGLQLTSPDGDVLAALAVRTGRSTGALTDRAIRLTRAIGQGALASDQAWPAAWRLLEAAAWSGERRAVEALLGLGLPPWAVELATWRGVLHEPACRDQILQHLGLPAPAGPLSSVVVAPPWHGLSPAWWQARFALRTDARLAVPSGYPWGRGAP